ncbi:MAG: hypothetical protein JW914_09395 [Syntrophaceae bacterium]|nr:hypothetical protein [Syntrophaceae bacterium]
MMKIIKIKSLVNFWWVFSTLTILFAITFATQSAFALSVSGASSSVTAAAMKLIGFCEDPKGQLDEDAVNVLVDYVLKDKAVKEVELPKIQEATGAYYEFDTRISFVNFLKYSYNQQVPSALTSPASIRYSIWNGLPGKSQKMPANWETLLPVSKPVIIHGIQRDAITPDLTTGVYYEYELQRTLILLNHKGKKVLITISKQIDRSNVGKKGAIIGSDDDWNYYYSDEPGSLKKGLGWVKSYIYDFFSVGVYVETGASLSLVRSGVFQWIRAGWSGVNFVQSGHVIKGMKRYGRNFKGILESPVLPPADHIVSAYQKLYALPNSDIRLHYVALQQAQRSLAIQSGKIKETQLKKVKITDNVSKRQMIEELMIEYFKVVMGKNSLLEKKQVLALINF